MMDARERLEALCRERGVDFSTLSKLLGKNPAYIQQFIRRGSPRRLGEDDRQAIARYFDIDEEELGGPPGAAPGGLVSVAQRPVRAAAGGGSINEEPRTSSRFAFDRQWLRDLTNASADHLSVIKVDGDSMSPTLAAGDDILIDHSDAEARLRDGIYVLRIDEALVVKRLALHPMGRAVTIQSDNPAYPDWPGCAMGDIDVVGRVLWSGRKID